MVDTQENTHLDLEDTKHWVHQKKEPREGIKKVSKNMKSEIAKVEKSLFNYLYIIGKGGFGKVWKVEHKKTKNQYAMKEMLKSM